MLKLRRILCRLGVHTWSQWSSTDTTLEPITGHEGLDSIEDIFVVETRTRYCEHCGKGHVKQLLKW